MSCDIQTENTLTFTLGACNPPSEGGGVPSGEKLDDDKLNNLAQRFGRFIYSKNSSKGSRYIKNCMTLPSCEQG